MVDDYERRYKLAVIEYYEAKGRWRRQAKLADGKTTSPKITPPAWMLLGTLPLRFGSNG